MLKPSEVWSKIRAALEEVTDGRVFRDVDDTGTIDKIAIDLITANTVSDVEDHGQSSKDQINFCLDKKTDGTPLMVATTYAIKKPDDGKVKVTPDRALILQYRNGSVRISSAKVPQW